MDIKENHITGFNLIQPYVMVEDNFVNAVFEKFHFNWTN